MADTMMSELPRLGVSCGDSAQVASRTPQAASRATRMKTAVLRLLRPRNATKAASACETQSNGTVVGPALGRRVTRLFVHSWRQQRCPVLHRLACFLATGCDHHNSAASSRTTLSRKANDAPQTSGAAGRIPLMMAGWQRRHDPLEALPVQFTSHMVEQSAKHGRGGLPSTAPE